MLREIPASRCRLLTYGLTPPCSIVFVFCMHQIQIRLNETPIKCLLITLPQIFTILLKTYCYYSTAADFNT